MVGYMYYFRHTVILIDTFQSTNLDIYFGSGEILKKSHFQSKFIHYFKINSDLYFD